MMAVRWVNEYDMDISKKFALKRDPKMRRKWSRVILRGSYAIY